SPLRNTVLIKQALKLLYSSEALYRSAKCWSSFIMVLGSSDLLEKRGNLLPLSLGEPPLGFQENVLAASSNFLEDLKSGVNVSLPSALFSGQLHHEASLILAVQAVQQTLCCDLPHLTSFLEIVLAFGKNFWALRLLLDQLACEEHILCGTASLLLRDLSREKATMLRVLRDLRDLIPFYLCKTGNFLDAAHSLLFPVNSLACCSACRISPCQFKVYLKIFRTGCVPSGNDVQDAGPWVTAGSPLRNTVLIKQALKLLYSSEALYRSAKCWSSFIMVLGSSDLLEKRGNLLPLSLGEPPLGFQENVLAASSNFLEDLKSGVNVSLPSALFSGQLHHEASLILAVQAVQQTLCCDLPHLTSFLEIVLAFGKNFWALRLLLDQLACEEHILCGTASLLLRDLSREKATMLRVWQNLGPQYVGEFLCLFLTCRHKRMQSVGLFSLNVIIENLHMCPWAKQLCTFFLESGLRQLPFGTTVHHEVSKFVSAFEKL
ncbi:PREDICTED: uncharacterized protein LOC106859246, partial [Sturnus vulgaris]|uniref:uncharacterized protein LOC106859246 n=1 Tax=Sturnus vulgaris TaxID=9172 RepID=UPI00071A0F43